MSMFEQELCQSVNIFEPLTILGVSLIDLAGLLIVCILAIIVSVLFMLYKQQPYRITMIRDWNGESAWRLERKNAWWFWDWEEVCRSKDKSEIQVKAKEVLALRINGVAKNERVG